jgi:hypothetical protein
MQEGPIQNIFLVLFSVEGGDVLVVFQLVFILYVCVRFCLFISCLALFTELSAALLSEVGTDPNPKYMLKKRRNRIQK